MLNWIRMRVLAVAVAALIAGGPAFAGGKMVIAHRGASGYLPEHTLEAYAMAHAMGADYIEPDLVLSKDGRLIALHDIHLESTTDVERQFPDRKRGDGKWYAVDFTLAELKSLNVHERLEGRFPKMKSHFEIPTFEDVIELVQGLNQTTGRHTGIYPELKQPSFHREAGFDMEKQVLAVLDAYGYTGPDAPVFLQCFEPESLKRIRTELGSGLPLIQLVSGGERQREFQTREGLTEIARYANGIGPDKDIIEQNPDYVTWAHELGLLVHPYTFRADQRPAQYPSFEEELRQFYVVYGVDAVFTDFPDRASRFLSENGFK